MGGKWHEVKVIGVVEENKITRRFFLEFTELQEFHFRPGQFIKLKITDDITRAYSIAAAIPGIKRLELLIALKNEGEGTPILFEKGQIGETFMVSEALGNFVLPEDPLSELADEVCFIATGTGIAPFRGMISELLVSKYMGTVNLIFGTRWMEDLLYRDKFDALDNIHPNFHYIPTLSREDRESWRGKKGRVHPIIESMYRDHRPCHFYICGWSEMVLEAKAHLLKMGYDKNHIHVENYG
jgi:CDP-4-dehydro-6-deoxyglucose reductase